MRRICFPALIVTALVLSSCSYGLLNFSSEVGDLEIWFEIEGDNALGVNSLVYTMTSPNGDSPVFTVSMDGDGAFLYIERMLSGTWDMSLGMMSGTTTVQTYQASVAIVTGERIHVDLRADYSGPEYDITYSSWSSGDSTGSDYERVFDVTDFQIYPELLYQYEDDSITCGYSAWISGSSFLSELEEVTLRQPVNGSYTFGYDYSRALFLSHLVEDDLITIRNRTVEEPSDINGAYILYLTDHAENLVRKELEVDIGSYESMIPRIISEISGSISQSSDTTFTWEITDSSKTGTILIFIVHNSSGSIYPADNTIAVTGASGDFTVPAGTLTLGTNEIIAASIGYATTTPVDDAAAVGLTSPDLRSGAFVESIQEIYGKNAGQIMFYSAYFTVE